MRASYLIKELSELIAKHGDLEVFVNSHENGFVEKANFTGIVKDWDGMEEDEIGFIIEY